VGSVGSILTHVDGKVGFVVEGMPPAAKDAQPLALFNEASDDFFRTVRVPLEQGRFFGADDREGAPPSMIVSEQFARRYLPQGNPVGARVHIGPDQSGPAFTVVGVVGDVRNTPARADAEPAVYLPTRQSPWNGPIVVVRTVGDPNAIVPAMRSALAAIDPTLPLHDIMTLDDIVADSFAGKRLPVVLMTAFGALALLLASVGVYAMFAAMAAAREREFAVRVALGSSRGAIAGLVLRQGGLWMAIGLVVGATGVLGVTRALRSLLFGVSPFDPIALGAAALLLFACGAAALLVPVRRASRADPISILR
jgi:putative ABC transport system permease protein